MQHMLSSRWLRIFLFLLILAIPLTGMVFIGCGGDDDDDDDDDDDVPAERGRVVRDLASAYDQQIMTLWNVFRLRMLSGQTELEGIDITSDAAFDTLDHLYTTVNEYAHYVSTVGPAGILRRSAPAEWDTVNTGTDLSSATAFVNVSANLIPSIGPVYHNQNGWCFHYMRPVIPGQSLESVLLAEASFDTLMRRTFAYHSQQSHEDECVLILEPDGRIIYDEDGEFYGEYFNNEDLFSQEHIAVADRILSETDGYDTYISDDVPGHGETGGERIIGWDDVIVEDSYWIMVVTEPVE